MVARRGWMVDDSMICSWDRTGRADTNTTSNPNQAEKGEVGDGGVMYRHLYDDTIRYDRIGDDGR